jgi:hypothetical protein
VMHVRLILVGLPEARHFLPKLFPGLQVRDETKSMLVFDLFLETRPPCRERGTRLRLVLRPRQNR